MQLAARGAHIVVADMNVASADETWSNARTKSSNEMGMAVALDLTSRESMAQALRATILQFGGVDIVINTAAIYPTPDPSGSTLETMWSKTLTVNVTSNHVLAAEAAKVFKAQGLPGSIVLTSSANAVVPKSGSEPYDVSKAAINHLIRELAIGLGPLVRVNGIAFTEDESTEALRGKLADFYAQRTITRRPIMPVDCANAICWLAGDQSAKTTGHVIPVDGGLAEAFLR